MQVDSIYERDPATRSRRFCGRFAICLICLLTFRDAMARQTPALQPQGVAEKTSHTSAQRGDHSGDVRAVRSNDAAAAGRKKEEVVPSATTPPLATPASVTLKDGILTVRADNSDLEQILKGIASAGGMTIDGTIASPRVFGLYGPGKPSEVLTSLLAGSGYNFIMVGATQEGAPRRLLLTLQNGAPTPAAAPAAVAAANSAETETPNATAPQPEEEPAGPGALTHIPPPPSDDIEQRTQQNLQRLQQMREQQQSTPP